MAITQIYYPSNGSILVIKPMCDATVNELVLAQRFAINTGAFDTMRNILAELGARAALAFDALPQNKLH
jgi:hypothetical protein